MSKLKLYYDLMSQPCRAMYIFMKTAAVPYEDVVVALRKNEQNKPEFGEINPFRKVPVLVDENESGERVIIRESCAMARYVSHKYLGSSSHWYPQDFNKNFLIDEFLHWQHANLRFPGSMMTVHSLLIPVRNKTPPDFEKVRKFKKEFDRNCDLFESCYLSGGRFIAGDEISVADLFAICELVQPSMTGFDVNVSRPRLDTWMKEVITTTQPHFDAAHTVMQKVKGMMAEGVQEAYRDYLEKEKAECVTSSSKL